MQCKEYSLIDCIQLDNSYNPVTMDNNPIKVWTHKGTGYKVFYYKGTTYYLHRVVYCLTYGNIPSGYTVDHIDRDKTNNYPNNLRLATQKEQNRNRKAPPKRDGLPVGVYHTSNGTYRAVVQSDYKQKSRRFKTLEAACEWLESQRKDLHKEFAFST